MKRGGPLKRRTPLERRTRIRPRNRKRAAARQAEAFGDLAEYVRGLGCLVCNRRPVEAAHVRSRGAGFGAWIVDAGALQIVDHQPVMDEPLGDRGVVSFRTLDELVDLVQYYLDHEEERAERAADAHRRVLEADCYAPRLARLLAT